MARRRKVMVFSFPSKAVFNNQILLTVMMVSLVLVWPVFGQESYSGTVEGVVVDMETEKPLSKVAILIKESDWKAVTDEQGMYSIPDVNPGEFEILATIDGYKEEKRVVKVASGEKAIANFRLSISEIVLDKILVTATKTQRSVDETPIPAALVDKEQIEKYNALNAGDAIEQLSGLQFYRSYGPMEDEKLRVQGLPAGYTLTLIDGERIEGRFPLSQIPAELVERVEVVKGPSSVLYGSDAIGGVVNVITRSFPLRPTAGIGYSYGTDDAQIADLNHGYSIGDFGYLLSFNRNRTKGEEIRRNWYNSDSFFTKLGWEPDLYRSIIAKGGYYKEELSNRGETKYDLNLAGNAEIGESGKLVVKGYGATSSDETHTGGAEEATISDSQKYRAETQFSGKIGNIHTVTLGAEVLYERLKHYLESEEADIDKDQHLESFYIQDEADFQRFSLLGAARFDHHSVWGNHFSPKAALLFRANDWLNIRTGVGGAFKAPSFERLYRRDFHGGGGGFWILGTTDLEPETSVGSNLDFMLSYGDRLNARIGLFRHDLENMIQGYMVYPDPEDESNRYYTYRNIGQAMSQGTEMEVRTRLFWGFSAAANYSFLDTKDKDLNKELAYTPHHKGKAELSYKNEWLGFGITVLEEFVGTRFEDTKNERSLEAYRLTSLKINQAIVDRVFLFFTIDNIFDEEYKDNRFSEDGRRFQMGLKLRI
jgi:outer membrane receptor for ferrienterochelin and colicins